MGPGLPPWERAALARGGQCSALVSHEVNAGAWSSCGAIIFLAGPSNDCPLTFFVSAEGQGVVAVVSKSSPKGEEGPETMHVTSQDSQGQLSKASRKASWEASCARATLSSHP